MWLKKGLVYEAPFDGTWKDNSALTPTPFKLSNEVIRVFCGFRDANGISRIGYVDVDSYDPRKIIKVSDKPVLDIGEHGMFDDNGVILGDVIRVNDSVLMFYVGFQLVQNVKFLAFSGVAKSEDNGNSFYRIQKTPILDRSDEALYIRAIHTVLFEGGKFKIWYATGSSWETINDIKYPNYDISYIESDSLDFSPKGVKCIEYNKNNFEYRIGRPRVYKLADLTYKMNFTYGTTTGLYQPGEAYSKDGIFWERRDENFPLNLSKEGWDSKHLCYPSIIDMGYKTYMFYNGNNMGEQGFGYAEFVK